MNIETVKALCSTVNLRRRAWTCKLLLNSIQTFGPWWKMSLSTTVTIGVHTLTHKKNVVSLSVSKRISITWLVYPMYITYFQSQCQLVLWRARETRRLQSSQVLHAVFKVNKHSETLKQLPNYQNIGNLFTFKKNIRNKFLTNA